MCATSYIRIAWPCLKEHFYDAAISRMLLFQHYLVGSRRQGEIGEFEDSGGLLLSINKFLELRAVCEYGSMVVTFDRSVAEKS